MFVSPTSLSDERWSSKYTQIFLLIEYPYPQHVDIGVHMLHMTPCNALFIAVIAQLNCQRILPFFPFFLLFFSPAITKQFQLQVVITTVRSKYLICFIQTYQPPDLDTAFSHIYESFDKCQNHNTLDQKVRHTHLQPSVVVHNFKLSSQIGRAHV